MTSPVQRTGTAPIAEPEEVTDVSVQASNASLAQDTSAVDAAAAGPPSPAAPSARDEPDVHVNLGPEHLLRQVRRPLSALGHSLRRLWQNGVAERSNATELERGGRRPSAGEDIPEERFKQNPGGLCRSLRRLRHRFCPPFRVVSGAETPAQESELQTAVGFCGFLSSGGFGLISLSLWRSPRHLGPLDTY